MYIGSSSSLSVESISIHFSVAWFKGECVGAPYLKVNYYFGVSNGPFPPQISLQTRFVLLLNRNQLSNLYATGTLGVNVDG